MDEFEYVYSVSDDNEVERLIKERQTEPYSIESGYDVNTWQAIVDAVNIGIDSHLEAIDLTRSTFKFGNCLVHPDDLAILVRRLAHYGTDEGYSLACDICETLGFELSV